MQRIVTLPDLPPFYGYNVVNEITKGRFSRVRLLRRTADNKFFVGKVKYKHLLDEKSKGQVNWELSTLKDIEHKNIVDRLLVISTTNYLYSIVEYLDDVAFINYIERGKYVGNEIECRNIFKQILASVLYLHSQNIVHGDLRLDHFLFDETHTTLKLTNFSSSRKCNSQREELFDYFGRLDHAAPEIFSDKLYNGFKADIWSLGTLLFKLYSNQLPFGTNDNLKDFKKRLFKCEYKLSLPASQELVTFFKCIFNPNLILRSNISMLGSSMWIHMNEDSVFYDTNCEASQDSDESESSEESSEEPETSSSYINPRPSLKYKIFDCFLNTGSRRRSSRNINSKKDQAYNFEKNEENNENISKALSQPPFEGYKILKNISYGKFSVVRKLKRNNKLFAGKVKYKSSVAGNLVDRIAWEIWIVKHVKHESIVKFYFLRNSKNRLFTIMEYLDDQALNNFINKRKYVGNEIECRNIFKQILASVLYLHSQNIVHGDLRLDHFLFDETHTTLKLTNFSSCRKSDSTIVPANYFGRLDHAAPEIYKLKPFSGFKADIWSLGVLLYNLLFNQLPFGSCENKIELKRRVLRCEYKLNEHCTSQFQELIETMLVVKPLVRTNLQKIETSSWMEDNEESLSDKDSTIYENIYKTEETQVTSKNESNRSNTQVKRICQKLGGCFSDFSDREAGSKQEKIYCKWKIDLKEDFDLSKTVLEVIVRNEHKYKELNENEYQCRTTVQGQEVCWAFRVLEQKPIITIVFVSCCDLISLFLLIISNFIREFRLSLRYGK